MPQLRLIVDDVTPAAARPVDDLPPGAAPAPGVTLEDGDDVPLYIGLARGIDWTIGALLGQGYRASDQRVDQVGEAIAPLGRRVAGLVGASGAVDQAVPPLVRETATLAAALYVAWGDAFVDAFKSAVAARRAEQEGESVSTESRPPRGDRGRANGGDRPARRPRPSAAGVGGAVEDPGEDGIRPPGPGEGRSADLVGAFAHGSRLGSGAG